MTSRSTKDSARTDGYRLVDEIPLLGNLAVAKYELTNGLQAAIVVDTTTPIFTYQTWFRTGSADEPAGRQGLAHLFEHMMFRKTSRREMGEFDRQVNINGGTGMNAYTSRDQTVYHFTFPKEKLEVAADLEADRMANLVIDAEMFETEKGAVLTERNRGLDDPTRYLWEELYMVAYTKHNYKYSTMGDAESITGFTVDEALGFYRDFYAPSNALIIIVGDVDRTTVMETLVRHYGGFTPQAAKLRAVTTEPFPASDRSLSLTHHRATQPMMAKLWHIPNMIHDDYPALAVVGKLLSSGKTSVLYERLFNTAKVTNLFADVYNCRDMGSFEFFGQLAGSVSFEEIDAILSAALHELANGKITADQIQIVKNTIERDTYHSATTPDSLAQKLGDAFINTGDLAFQLNLVERIARVTPGDVARVTRTYLTDAPSTTATLLPSLSHSILH